MKTAADFPEVFDAYGHIRSDLHKEQDKIDALESPERESFFECIKAVTATQAGEQRVLKARRSVRDLETAYDQAVKAFELAHPMHLTQADNMRAVTAAQKPGYKPTTDDGTARVKTLAAKVAALETKYADLNADDEPNRADIEKAAKALARARAALAADPVAVKAALETASEAVSRARAEMFQATSAQRTLELVSGNAIDAWRRCIPLITAEAIHRKMCRDEAERRIAIANGSAPAPVIPEKVIPSELDRILSTRGKTKTNRMPAYHGPR